MSDRAKYVLCRIGPYGLLIPIDAVRHVWTSETPSEAWQAAPRIDLGDLFGLGPQSKNAHVAYGHNVQETVVLAFDAVVRLETIAETELRPLPPVFRFAGLICDAVCRRALDGIHALRFCRRPDFTAAMAWRSGTFLQGMAPL